MLFPSYALSSDIGMMRLSLIDGDVQIYTNDAGDWVPASINIPLNEEDRLWVPKDGKAELQIRQNAIIRLGGKTSFDVVSLDEEAAQFYQEKGYSYINNRRGGINKIQVDTPLSSLSFYENSIIMVDVSDNGVTEVSVLKGYVYAESRNGKTRVNAGNSIYIGEDLYAKISMIGQPDDWEKWNRNRDKKLYGIAESSRYLPDELDAYSSDFDGYGRWFYTPAYGYVWTPTLTISIGWSPYRIGRWVWIGGDYVWISYEPWGWAPYHYGRWAFVARIGWCWVPPLRGEVYWGPGFVGWVYTPTYVAWVPLAPGEIYYGYGHYGPSSVNIININIQETVIKREFRNIKVQNAVTVISKDSFISGKKREFKVKDNPFVTERISVGPPVEIKPEKATKIPVIKRISPSATPPEKIRQIKIEEIKKDRKFVRDESDSAFKKGATRVEPLPLKEVKEPKKVIKREFKSAPSRIKAVEEEKKPKRKAAPVKPEKKPEDEKGKEKEVPAGEKEKPRRGF